MSSAVTFLERLLHHGEAVMHEQPVFSQEDRPALARLLEAAYDEHRLDVAEPLLPFESESALAAAQFLAHACWHLVKGDAPVESLEKSLHVLACPVSPGSHLSADLCLRHLATVYRRVRIRPPTDALHKSVVEVLRRWPLAGAGTDVAEMPTSDLQFHDHYGLQLLYAERLAANFRSAWIPTTGRTREVVELVLMQLKRVGLEEERVSS